MTLMLHVTRQTPQRFRNFRPHIDMSARSASRRSPEKWDTPS
jgi:hypothetical protein